MLSSKFFRVTWDSFIDFDNGYDKSTVMAKKST